MPTLSSVFAKSPIFEMGNLKKSLSNMSKILAKVLETFTNTFQSYMWYLMQGVTKKLKTLPS